MKGLRDLRRASGLTQWDVARATGIDRSRVSLIETGCVQAKPEEEQVIRGALQSAMQARLRTIQTALGSGATPLSV